jgi:hypothetical protein
MTNIIGAEECGNCRYWTKLNPNDLTARQGVCRRNPPTCVLTPGQRPGEIMVNGQYPPTMRDMWCGQWAGRGGN